MTSPATTTVTSSCSYCGVGCGMVLEIAVDPATGRRRVAKVSGDKEHPTNRGRLCTKGATSADMLRAGGRLERAMVRPERGAPLEALPMTDAIEETARRLRSVIDEHGPQAVAFYVSGQMSLEAQYLSNKLAKGFVRTNQIESNSRLCMASAGTGYKLSLGSDGPPGSYQDFDHADVFFVIGSNMADCHPILFLRMMDRVKAGAKLIVVDPRRTATADKADLFLQVKPGTDLALLNGLLHLLVADGQIDEEFIAEATEGWEQMPGFLADYPPSTVAELTGVAEEDLRTAARWIGESENWMSCWTMGLNQSTHGTWNTNALVNLHLATGAICRLGSGPFSLTGQPNAMGGREMGYMGPGLPGQRSVVDPDDRAFVEQAWGLADGTLSTEVGTGTIDMYERMVDGTIKACWIICTNPVASVSNRSTVIQGLESCELVIAQDAFLDTETNAYADILLPGALWAESTYVTVSSDRNLTLLQQAADPVGDAMPDWQIIAEVACAMGYADAFTYASAEEVFEEIRQFWNPRTGYDLRGVSYDRLARTPVQWPSPPQDATTPDDDGRNPIRYLNDGVSQHLLERPDGTRPRLAFATTSGRAVFFARPHMDAREMPDDDYPFVLNTGRLQHQWHTLTKTGKVPSLNRLNPGPFVEIHPDDAARLSIVDGDSLEISSRRGRAVLPASVSDRVQPGNLFAPFHWNDTYGEYLAVNAVTNDAVDPLSFQPEFKVSAVALTKVATPAPARRRRPSRGRPVGDRPHPDRPGHGAQRSAGPLTGAGAVPAGAALGARPDPAGGARRAAGLGAVRRQRARVDQRDARRLPPRRPGRTRAHHLPSRRCAGCGCSGPRRRATPRSTPSTSRGGCAPAGSRSTSSGWTTTTSPGSPVTVPCCWSAARSATGTRRTTARRSGAPSPATAPPGSTACATRCSRSATRATTTSAATVVASTPGSRARRRAPRRPRGLRTRRHGVRTAVVQRGSRHGSRPRPRPPRRRPVPDGGRPLLAARAAGDAGDAQRPAQRRGLDQGRAPVRDRDRRRALVPGGRRAERPADQQPRSGRGVAGGHGPRRRDGGRPSRCREPLPA